MVNDAAPFKGKYYSSDYLTEALRLINAWFVDSATKMNPKMDYGQIIPTGPYGATSAT